MICIGDIAVLVTVVGGATYLLGLIAVAWNVFFRVNEPNRNYYLEFFPAWKEVPGTHVSYGDADYTFHVKTR
jgi:hypothetical protein